MTERFQNCMGILIPREDFELFVISALGDPTLLAKMLRERRGVCAPAARSVSITFRGAGPDRPSNMVWCDVFAPNHGSWSLLIEELRDGCVVREVVQR